MLQLAAIFVIDINLFCGSLFSHSGSDSEQNLLNVLINGYLQACSSLGNVLVNAALSAYQEQKSRGIVPGKWVDRDATSCDLFFGCKSAFATTKEQYLRYGMEFHPPGANDVQMSLLKERSEATERLALPLPGDRHG